MVRNLHATLSEVAEPLAAHHKRLKAQLDATLAKASSLERTEAIAQLSEEIRGLARELREQAKRERDLAKVYSAINEELINSKRTVAPAKAASLKQAALRAIR